MEYVYQQRLETAKSLLINTTLPVNVIGRNLGMPNSAYFSRMFREKVGTTPQEYRLQHN
jgi:two-component system response regulator YesN